MTPETSGDPIRVGIAGFGLAGEVFHGPLIAATPGLQVTAIVTGDPGRSARAGEKHPEALVAGTVEEIWPQIDLLVVAVPNRLHAELALEAISHDIAVVIDKPFATAAEDAQRVIDADGRVTVFQNRRWDGDFLTVRSLLDAGRLGEVVRFDSRFERFRPHVREGWRESGDPSDGGGQLADLGAHLIDQAIELFGPPESVYAEVDLRRPGVKADDDVFVSLEHADRVRSHLHMGVLAPLAGRRFKVSGLGGGFEVVGLDPQEAQLRDGMDPGSPDFGERPPGRLVEGADGKVEELPIERGRYPDFYAGVEEWIREGGAPPVDPADSLRVLKVIEAARESANRREAVAFSG